MNILINLFELNDNNRINDKLKLINKLIKEEFFEFKNNKLIEQIDIYMGCYDR